MTQVNRGTEAERDFLAVAVEIHDVLPHTFADARPGHSLPFLELHSYFIRKRTTTAATTAPRNFLILWQLVSRIFHCIALNSPAFMRFHLNFRDSVHHVIVN